MQLKSKNVVLYFVYSQYNTDEKYIAKYRDYKKALEKRNTLQKNSGGLDIYGYQIDPNNYFVKVLWDDMTLTDLEESHYQ